MHNYIRHIFDSLSKKEKLNYIDNLIEKRLDLSEEEFKSASSKQKEEYIKIKFTTRRQFKLFEIQYMPFDELRKYIKRNNNFIDYEIIRNLDSKKREKIIAQIADSKILLSKEKFDELTNKEKRIYAKYRLDKFLLITNYVLRYLDAEDQKKFIDYSLESNISFSQETIDALKVPAKKYYENNIPPINESKLINLIRNRVKNNLLG